MYLSLIVATINRTKELDSFLNSISREGSPDFEVIIVDQNSDDRLKSIISKYTGLDIKHFQIPPRGASNARNFGAKYASGKIFGFPDDDCLYLSDTISQVKTLMTENRDLITGKCIDMLGNSSVANYELKSTMITPHNVWDSGVEATIFIRKELFDKLSGFNESLGVGTKPFGSGEGTDLILRALKLTTNIYFYPDLLVQHPKIEIEGSQAYRRAFSYGMGIGRVHRLNKTPLSSKARSLIRPFVATLLYLLLFKFKKSKFYFLSLYGRVLGLTHKG